MKPLTLDIGRQLPGRIIAIRILAPIASPAAGRAHAGRSRRNTPLTAVTQSRERTTTTHRTGPSQTAH